MNRVRYKKPIIGVPGPAKDVQDTGKIAAAAPRKGKVSSGRRGGGRTRCAREQRGLVAACGLEGTPFSPSRPGYGTYLPH